jgi:hypothetical protein
MAEARERAREADSWVGAAVREWTERAGEDGDRVGLDADARDGLVRELEDDAGAPGTPGWNSEV